MQRCDFQAATVHRVLHRLTPNRVTIATIFWLLFDDSPIIANLATQVSVLWEESKKIVEQGAISLAQMQL